MLTMFIVILVPFIFCFNIKWVNWAGAVCAEQSSIPGLCLSPLRTPVGTGT